MKKIKIIFCIIVNLLCTEIKPIIIFLHGTSSAGKSSIARELMQQLDTYRLFELDTHQGPPKFYQSIASAANNSYNCIVDTVLIHKKSARFCFELLHSYQVCFVLVYCPLTEIEDHVQQKHKRQREICKKKQGSLYASAIQFTHFYKPDEDSSLTIDTITRQELLTILALVQEELLSNDLSEKISKVNRNFNKTFLNVENETIPFTGSFTYDLIVNTSTHNKEECAQQIITYVQSDQPCTAFYQSYLSNNQKVT